MIATIIGVFFVGVVRWRAHARQAFMIACEEKIDPLPAGCGCFAE
jgi:hypothetical protein